MRYSVIVALVVVAVLATAEADALSRRMLGAEVDAAGTAAVPQGGNSGPDSWQFTGGSGGKIWQKPGFGGGVGRGRDKWGNGMQSQEAATSSTPAIPSTGPAQGAEVRAAPQEADKAAVTTTVAAAGAVTP